MGRRERRLIIGISIAALLLGGCTGTPSCPTTVEGIREEAFLAGLPDDALVGIGRIIRFIASSDAEFRGYDVAVETRVRGFAPDDQVVFVRSPDRLAGIHPDQRVIITGFRGDQPASITQGPCPIINPLVEE
jgi:hypothetical protein